MQHFVSAMLGGVLVAVLFLILLPDRQDHRTSVLLPPVSTRGPMADSSRGGLGELREIRERLLDLERARGSDLPAAPAALRTAEAADAPELRRRVRELEAQVTGLSRRLSFMIFEPDPADDPEEQRRRIEYGISSALNDKRYAGRVARIPLLVCFLERWPQHKHAPSMLRELVYDYRETQQHHRAMAAIDHYGPLLRLPDGKLDGMRLSAARNDAERLRLVRRIAQSTPEWSERAWANYEVANTLARLGRHAQALAAVEEFLSAFGNTNPKYVERAHALRKKLLAR